MTRPRRHVLFLALEFAPVQLTGAFRSIKLVKYLREFGIEPIVVTIDPAQASDIFQAPINPALLDDLPADIAVNHLTEPARRPLARTGARAALRIFLALDDGFHRRFRASLRETVTRIARTHRIDAVYASLPPFGAGQLGHDAARILGVPLLVDMRDAWALWGAGPYPSWFHFRWRLARERALFAAAARIVTVTDRLRDLFRRTHPALARERFATVANGFDGPLFGTAEPFASSGKTCRIAYVGSYYYQPRAPRPALPSPRALFHAIRHFAADEQWEYRSPLFFFRAWARLRERDPAAAARIEFHHIGAVPAWLPGMAEAHGVRAQCRFDGPLLAQDVPAALAGMDALLATAMKREDGGDYCLASKTFDYLAARRPILAFVPEGSQRDFLAGSGVAVMIDPDDVDAGADALARLVAAPLDLTLDADHVNAFHRRESAARMAAELDAMIDERIAA